MVDSLKYLTSLNYDVLACILLCKPIRLVTDKVATVDGLNLLSGSKYYLLSFLFLLLLLEVLGKFANNFTLLVGLQNPLYFCENYTLFLRFFCYFHSVIAGLGKWEVNTGEVKTGR